MKKVLIATSNQQKFEIDMYLLKKAGMSSERYRFFSLADIDCEGLNKKEVGNNLERAKQKAQNVIENLKDNPFDYILGIDDGMVVKGEKKEDIKDYLKKILFENYLSEGESIAFSRAYYMVAKNGVSSSAEALVPFTYKSAPQAILENHPYPLEQIALPLGKDKTLSQLSKKEYYEYYWSKSRSSIQALLKPFEISLDKSI